MLFFIACLTLFCLSAWNAHWAGRYWTETRATGGLTRLFVVLAVVGSGFGFTVAYAGLLFLLVDLAPIVDELQIWYWLLLGGMAVMSIVVYPIEGMLVVWRKRRHADPSLQAHGNEPYILAVWRETAERPGVLRTVTRRVNEVLPERFRRRTVWRRTYVDLGNDGSDSARSSGSGVRRSRSSGGRSGGSGESSDVTPPVVGSTPVGAPPFPIPAVGSGGAKLSGFKSGGGGKMSRGGGSSGGLFSGFSLDIDDEIGLLILVIAIAIIALLSGVMTTWAIVHRADQNVALDVLREAWYEWEV